MKRLLKVLPVVIGLWLMRPYYSCLPLERWLCFHPTAENVFLVDDQDFQRLPPPSYGDWLYHHREWGQSFWGYIRSKPPKPSKLREKIVFQPLGDFSPEQQELLEKTREFCELFFTRPVRVEKTLPLDPALARSRAHGLQYKTPRLLREVLQPTLPEDAFCYLGITVQDLYYQENWNFVYGSAVMKGRVGVFSLARYDPKFHGEEIDESSQALMLRRSCSVMAHEAGHSFGLEHCVYYGCLMQGSNHLGELDDKPLHLCPICLAKLRWALDCDLTQRYEGLLEFYRAQELDREAGWVQQRLQRAKDLAE